MAASPVGVAGSLGSKPTAAPRQSQPGPLCPRSLLFAVGTAGPVLAPKGTPSWAGVRGGCAPGGPEAPGLSMRWGSEGDPRLAENGALKGVPLGPLTCHGDAGVPLGARLGGAWRAST